MTTVDTFETPQTRDQLPEGWRVVRFDQMADSITERVDNPAEAGVTYYVGLEHLDPESLHIRRWGAPTDVEATKLRFQPGDIIFGRRRAYQRKIAVAEFEGICSAHALVLRAKEETVVKEFLPFFMQSDTFFERAMSISVGSLSPTINWKTLAQQEFAIPPKDEQRRIAEILWAVDEAVLKTLSVIVNIELLKNSTLMAILDQKNISDISVSHKKWPIYKLGDVCRQITDGTHFTPTYTDSGVPFLRVTDIQSTEIDWDKVKYISEEEHKTLISRCYPETGDVLLSKNGTVGITKVVDWDRPFSIFVSLCLIKTGNDLDPYYLCEVLRSNMIQSQFHARSKQGTVKNLHLEEIRECLIPLPPLEDQHQIVSIADNFDTSMKASISELYQFAMEIGH